MAVVHRKCRTFAQHVVHCDNLTTFTLSDDIHRVSLQQLKKQVWHVFNRQGLQFVKQVSVSVLITFRSYCTYISFVTLQMTVSGLCLASPDNQ